MDEMRMVRDLYPDPAPPTARETAQARALLAQPPRRLLPRLKWGLGGVLAAGTAAALAITLTTGNTSAPPEEITLDGRKAVLAAAEQAERQPTGEYWYVDRIDGQSFIVRPKTGTYAITGAHSQSFAWWGAEPGTGEGAYIRDLPARPRTAADEELWRKAGSPSVFRGWAVDHPFTHTTKTTKWQAGHTDRNGGGRFLDDRSIEDLQNLPTDPDKLTKMFLTGEHGDGAFDPAGEKGPMEPHAKVMRVGGLLMGTPIPPKVRAGLMRALAAQPGIEAIGHSTDSLGRRGVALASEPRAVTVTGEHGAPKADHGTYRTRTVVVFDEKTGALLSEQEELAAPGGPYAQMKPGFIIHHWTVHAAGWTDTKPTTPPADLPFD